METFLNYILDYGAMGLFCGYLIYDKKVLMGKIVNTLEKLIIRIEKCPNR